jgi:hypothetical protein
MAHGDDTTREGPHQNHKALADSAQSLPPGLSAGLAAGA